LTDLDDPGSLSEIARAEFGITKSLPRSVLDAFEYLSDDKEMVSMLGERFVQSYLSVKKVEIHYLGLTNF
jgi:glutamine synthetase